MQYKSLTPTSLLPDIDIEHCPNCGGALKIIAAIEDPPALSESLFIWACLAVPRRARRRSDSIYSNGLRAETGYQRKPSPPLGLSSSERCDLKHFARLRLLRRPNQQKQHRDFHRTEKGSTPRSGDIARSRKKVV
jgi:hypothetical protein